MSLDRRVMVSPLSDTAMLPNMFQNDMLLLLKSKKCYVPDRPDQCGSGYPNPCLDGANSLNPPPFDPLESVAGSPSELGIGFFKVKTYRCHCRP